MCCKAWEGTGGGPGGPQCCLEAQEAGGEGLGLFQEKLSGFQEGRPQAQGSEKPWTAARGPQPRCLPRPSPQVPGPGALQPQSPPCRPRQWPCPIHAMTAPPQSTLCCPSAHRPVLAWEPLPHRAGTEQGAGSRWRDALCPSLRLCYSDVPAPWTWCWRCFSHRKQKCTQGISREGPAGGQVLDMGPAGGSWDWVGLGGGQGPDLGYLLPRLSIPVGGGPA